MSTAAHTSSDKTAAHPGEKSFDPSGPAFKNGCFFSFDHTFEEAQFVFLSLPWDVTTSYRDGTRNGPEAIIEASYQVDLFHPYTKDIYNLKAHTLPFPTEWLKKSLELRPVAQRIIEKITEDPSKPLEGTFLADQKRINSECARLNSWSEMQVQKIVEAKKIPITVGGDHAVSLGPIRALSKFYKTFSILHFDAHADLRIAYEGFEFSHASIMDEALKVSAVDKLVQIGIRDVSEMEVARIQEDSRIKTFFDWELKGALDAGVSWAKIVQDILSPLSQNVYISFDIDGFDPKLCPNTGTPVPGGQEFWHVRELLRQLKLSGRKIIGADLVEVSPDPATPWNENVGARTLFEILATAYS